MTTAPTRAEIADEIEKLMPDLVPGPWRHDPADIGTLCGWHYPDEFRPVVHCSGGVTEWLAHSELIVLLRNNLPVILAALRGPDRAAVERAADAIFLTPAPKPGKGSFLSFVDQPEVVRDVFLAQARAALAAAGEQK